MNYELITEHTLYAFSHFPPRYLYCLESIFHLVVPMVFIFDGKSGIVVHIKRDLRYLIYLRHLFRSRAVTNLQKGPICLNSCSTYSRLPSNISTMVVPRMGQGYSICLFTKSLPGTTGLTRDVLGGIV